MFKVKNKITEEITQVLDTYCDEYGKTWFLLWVKDKWVWRAADAFVPPNYTPKKRVIVAGSRTFQNYPMLCKELDKIKEQIDEVVCGEARGADTLGSNWAYGNNIKIKSFPADWQKYGQRAGMIRNSEMADYADCLIAFWDGQSAGTQDMIDKMEKRGKEVHVIYYDKSRTD